MKYRARALDSAAADVSRGHDRHPLRELALLTAALAVLCGALYLGAMVVTDFVVARISPAVEGRVFAVFGSTLPQPDELDAELGERKVMADRMLAQLMENTDLKGLPVTLIVWDTPQTNAVALPGGTIALTKGLLRSLDEEAGMGFVLAHELGHFHGRDHLRGWGRRLGFKVLMAVLFSGGEVQLAADHAGDFVMLAHSRSREVAADRYAMDLLFRTMGTTSGATRLFELLGREGVPSWAYMLNTHPATRERIAALKKQAGQLAAASITTKATPADRAPTVSAANGAVAGIPKFAGSQSYLGAITRGPVDRKELAFCFTAHEYAEGAEVILSSLARHNAKASFFLTGDFLANTNYTSLTRRIIREGHYVGPHSDKHLLYCSWDKDRQTLISWEEFREDLARNVEKIHKHRSNAGLGGKVSNDAVRLFMPPYEHYNAEIARWTTEMGFVLINYTGGTRSNADYTGEADRNFVSSQKIYESILAYEERDPHGLNGFMLLLHLGAGPGREDKFHAHFPRLIEDLAKKGYRFVTVEELLGGTRGS
jgi:Zn-dependent protease with chaperone function/peptidoglycan/xylan/chitin deacetylase (PgdA/CDA1 family)